MAYVILTATDGTNRSVDPTLVRAVFPLAEDNNAPAARARILSANGYPAVDVPGTAAAAVAALGLSGYATLLLSQAVSGPTTLGGANAFVMAGGSPQLQAIVLSYASGPLTHIQWDDGSMLVVGVALATVATALAGSPPVAGSGILLAAGLCDILGVVLAQWSGDLDITVANAAGHVVGSGSYSHAVSGADAPAGAFLVFASPNGPRAAPLQSYNNAPGNFLVLTGSPLRGSANMAANGTIGDAVRVFLSAPYVGGSGLYEYQVETAGNFVVIPSIQNAIPVGGGQLSWAITGPDTFTVTAKDDALAAIDLAHGLVVVPVAAAQAMVAADESYGWQIVAAS
jgi:hypothetical protein